MSRHISSYQFSLYLDERVGGPEKGSIESHLSACQACRHNLSSLRTARDILRKSPPITESDGFDFEFRRKLNEELAMRNAAPVYQEKLEAVLEGLAAAILRPVPVLAKATALVTITAFLAVYMLWGQMGVAPAIASVDGQAQVYNLKDKQWHMARKGMRLKKGDVLKVGKNSQVNIESKKYGILLKEDTEIAAVCPEKPFGKSSEISYGLNKGRMLVATNKKYRDVRLKVESPLADVRVKGTGFLVNVSPAQSNRTWVGVLDGKVEVGSRIKQAKGPSNILVEAGKATEVLPGAAPSAPRYLLEEEWNEVQEIYRVGEEPQVALLISMTPRRVNELLRPAGLYISAKKTKAMPKALVGIVSQINEAIIKKDKQKHLDALGSLEKLVNKHPSAKYDIQFLFFISGYYYYLDEYQKAASVLDRIISNYPASGLISLALCAKGIIYEKDINDPVKAAGAYKAVLARYPHSLEAKEAIAGLRRLKANK